MNIFESIFSSFATLVGIINWKLKNPINDDEKLKINNLLTPDYYIILTRNNNHLSSYMIGIADFFLRGRFGYWGHAL